MLTPGWDDRTHADFSTSMSVENSRQLSLFFSLTLFTRQWSYSLFKITNPGSFQSLGIHDLDSFSMMNKPIIVANITTATLITLSLSHMHSTAKKVDFEIIHTTDNLPLKITYFHWSSFDWTCQQNAKFHSLHTLGSKNAPKYFHYPMLSQKS